MSRRRTQQFEFDPLLAARQVLHDPSCYAAGSLDGHTLNDVEQEALYAELQTMAELAEEALLPGDPDRDAILAAFDVVRMKQVVIPAGR